MNSDRYQPADLAASAPGVCFSLSSQVPGARGRTFRMSSQARRYCDLVLELKAVRSVGGDANRESDLAAEILELWRELNVDERLAVERALIS